MLFDAKISFRIESVLKLSWEMGSAYAKERPHHALSIRLSGDASFESGGEYYHASAGDLIYVPKGVDYKITSSQPESVIVVHFDILDGDGGKGIEVFRPKNPDIFIDLFSKMYRVWREKPIGYGYRADSLLSRVLEGIVGERFLSRHGMHAEFSTLLDFLHANYTDPSVTVNSLAKRISVSGTYLRRLFHDNLGTSPIKYLTALRLAYATELIDTGFYTVEEVAQKSGFNDAKYFSTVYKRRFGIPPSKR